MQSLDPGSSPWSSDHACCCPAEGTKRPVASTMLIQRNLAFKQNLLGSEREDQVPSLERENRQWIVLPLQSIPECEEEACVASSLFFLLPPRSLLPKSFPGPPSAREYVHLWGAVLRSPVAKDWGTQTSAIPLNTGRMSAASFLFSLGPLSC